MSTDIKRISVEEGAALFERAMMSPKPGEYFDGARCGCLIGALVVAADGFDDVIRRWSDDDDLISYDPSNRAVELGYDESYVGGLMTGFDSPGKAARILATNEEGRQNFRLGLIDGAAIRQRVLPVATEG